jgi:UDP-GlcNAc:undecaprenyl-phosphate GlcNAc-1-phosphate transferase
MLMLADSSSVSVVEPYMPVFFVSFVVTLCLTPLMRYLAIRYGVVDEPDGYRKIHVRPVAYLGGVATFLGWLAGILVSTVIRPPVHDPSMVTAAQVPPGIIFGAGTVMLFGLFDDVYGLAPRLKLLGQFLGAGLLYFLSVTRQGLIGPRIDLANMIVEPLVRHHLIMNFPALLPNTYMSVASIFSALVTVVVIMGACNALNLLDGMDGLCSGVTSIMSIGYLLLSVYLAAHGLSSVSITALNPARITISMALLGSVLGFLPFNFNPASIFMGDTGSMFLGFVCGAMILLFGNDGIFRWFLASVIIFGLPLLDTLLAIVRRKLAGRPIFSPDAGHFHHFLLRRGLSVKKAALLSYFIAIVFVGFAFVIVLIPTMMAMALYMVLFAWLVIVAFKIGMVSWSPKSSAAMAPPSATQAGSVISAPPLASATGTDTPPPAALDKKASDSTTSSRPQIV